MGDSANDNTPPSGDKRTPTGEEIKALLERLASVENELTQLKQAAGGTSSLEKREEHDEIQGNEDSPVRERPVKVDDDDKRPVSSEKTELAKGDGGVWTTGVRASWPVPPTWANMISAYMSFVVLGIIGVAVAGAFVFFQIIRAERDRLLAERDLLRGILSELRGVIDSARQS